MRAALADASATGGQCFLWALAAQLSAEPEDICRRNGADFRGAPGAPSFQVLGRVPHFSRPFVLGLDSPLREVGSSIPQPSRCLTMTAKPDDCSREETEMDTPGFTAEVSLGKQGHDYAFTSGSSRSWRSASMGNDGEQRQVLPQILVPDPRGPVCTPNCCYLDIYDCDLRCIVHQGSVTSCCSLDHTDFVCVGRI